MRKEKDSLNKTKFNCLDYLVKGLPTARSSCAIALL